MRGFLSFVFAVWATAAYAGHSEPVACAQLPALTGNITTAAGGCATTTVTVPAGATVADAIQQQYVVSTTELDATNTATLALITGLSVPLTAGKTYNCHGHVSITSGSATAGAKIGLIANGGLTVTSMTREIRMYSGTTLSVNNTATALDATSGGAGAAASITDAVIEAGVVVNVAGNIQVAGAQDVATSGGTNTAKFLINSTFNCVRVN